MTTLSRQRRWLLSNRKKSIRWTVFSRSTRKKRWRRLTAPGFRFQEAAGSLPGQPEDGRSRPPGPIFAGDHGCVVLVRNDLREEIFRKLGELPAKIVIREFDPEEERLVDVLREIKKA